MPRVRRGIRRRTRRKKILKLAKGYYGAKGRLYRTALEAVDRSLQFAYRDRKDRKRQFRRLWVSRIGAAARLNDLSYSKLMGGLKKAGVDLDRKILADLAVTDPEAFSELSAKARQAISEA